MDIKDYSSKVAEDILEISSQQRLQILLSLAEKKSNLTYIVKEMDATSSEIHRNLSRLLKAKIISKNNEGFYELTTYGKMILNQVPAWQLFIEKKEYFTKHSFDNIDNKFIRQVGSLADSELIKGFVKVQECCKAIYNEAENYIYNILYEVPYETDLLKMLAYKIQKGVRIKSIFTESVIFSKERNQLLEKSDFVNLIKQDKIERRTLKEDKILVTLNEKHACVMFSTIEGEIDVSQTLYSENKDFHEWCFDYFQYCWSKSVPFREKTNTISK